MKLIVKYLCACFLILFTIYACNKKENTKPIAFEMEQYILTDSTCKDTSCSTVDISYIQLKSITSKPFSDSFDLFQQKTVFGFDSIQKKYFDNPKYFAQFFINESVSTRAVYPDMPMWYSITSQQVLYNKNGIFSISTTTEDFYGGAHPSGNIQLDNFDVATGKKIKLYDIIDDKSNQMMYIGEQYFRKNQGLNNGINLEDAGYFVLNENEQDDGKFKFTENFSFTETGLRFVYAEYEIGPYAIGMPEFTIPYSELKNVAKSNSILIDLISK